MATSESNPQPSSPLNLLYKGVFSTRIGSNSKSKVGQYLDKLYQIKFLGIGTLDGAVMPGIVDAVMVRLTSVDGLSQTYTATRKEKKNESIVLEELAGKAEEKKAVVSGSKLATKPKDLPSNVLDSYSKAKNIREAEIDVGVAADQIREFDQLLYVLSQAVLRQVQDTDEELYKRLDQIKDGLADDETLDGKRHVRESISEHIDLVLQKALEGQTDNLQESTKPADEGGFLPENQAYSLIRDVLLEKGFDAHYMENKQAKVDEEIQLRKGAEGETGSSMNMDDAVVREIDVLQTLEFQEETKNYAEVLSTSQGGKRLNAEIKYEHDLVAEDSREYQAVLDALRAGFDELLYGKAPEEGVAGEDILALAQGNRKAVASDDQVIFDRPIQTADLIDYLTGNESINSREGLTYSFVGAVKGSKVTHHSREEEVIGNKLIITNTYVNNEYALGKIAPWKGHVLDSEHGEMSDLENSTLVYDPPIELLGEWVENKNPIVPAYDTELITAAVVDSEQTVTVDIPQELWGEYSDPDSTVLTPDSHLNVWGELTSQEVAMSFALDTELWGDMDGQEQQLSPELPIEVTGSITSGDSTFTDYDTESYEIAVLGCSDNRLTFRRRPDLKPDPKPEDPLFEWVCTEGYVCDDWLIVPLKDFNFENPDMEGFYDPVTLKPYFPTGKTDANGDPYVLPPYSILNEPLSNGVEVGGQHPMSIDPCNLYSFIEYIVKIYDAYKSRFRASTPIDSVSRVMNMLYDQVLKLISEWDKTKGYGIDELWRIYRFIRWIALGITNRFYRIKLVYTYGDFVEQFEAYPFSESITTEGAIRKNVQTYGYVLEGHPIQASTENKASIEFKVPQKTHSTTISFELGNNTPDRPDNVKPGGIMFQENFEGAAYQINGTGWVPVMTQAGTSLGIEHPAQARTYKTNTFAVLESYNRPHIKFNYGFDTNLETVLTLRKSNETAVWTSPSSADYSFADVTVSTGEYYFEVTVPQPEGVGQTELSFTAQNIQDGWLKVGEQTLWEVKNNTIYEVANTGAIAMVINQQWKKDIKYTFEGEFMTSGGPTGLEDWIGFIFNYRDPSNYYAVGSYGATSPYLNAGTKSGVWKITNGQNNPYENVVPTWKIQNGNFTWDFNVWYKIKVEVDGNNFKVYLGKAGSTLQQVLSVTDSAGWGYGGSGLAAYSNPYSTFRNIKYYSEPRFNAFIDNVVVTADSLQVPVKKPKYLIDFYLEDEKKPRIANYSADGKRAFSFPILSGEHKGRWVFKKQGQESSIALDASFIDNIVIRGIKPVKVDVEEELIGCGGHLAVKLLIENLLEYYRRHHQGCKGDRNIWIIE
ncbi:hypothetical protein IAQ67_29125 (plasmid) [Paenibacillus peoriae]|uniref:Uncharacterized protein n=1 Tax=Paenibacillus peoriae TaxID=59893 RepID=A0A7H0YH59_9BACL|nr:hypothetical protein [Paenibacillus peoriae]QNR70417.1 hypothetical protein IAQ67_29125 [Paenibacillus peoriae]